MEKHVIPLTFCEKELIAFGKIVTKNNRHNILSNTFKLSLIWIVVFLAGITGCIFSFHYSIILLLLSAVPTLWSGYLLFDYTKMLFMGLNYIRKSKGNVEEWKKGQKNPPIVRLILQGNFLIFENEMLHETSEMRIDEQNIFTLQLFKEGFVVQTTEGGLDVVKESMSAADFEKTVAHLKIIKAKGVNAI